jgi:ribosomal protein S18 acetylase RimI-like enzyme
VPDRDWTIRTAGSADTSAVLELWATAHAPPGVSDSAEGIASLLATDPDALLLAETDAATVGSLVVAWDGWRGNFYRLAVAPDRRREGIGSALLREGERRLRDRGALRLSALVAEDDALALAFWESAGYELQSNRVRFLRHLEPFGD